VAMPAVGVRVLAAFLLGACLLGCTSKACTLAGVTPCCVTVRFDLRQLPATVPVDAQVWACVDETELDESRPNGPGCDPAVFDGDVLATPEGDLIQQ
jgi:hypothetical protein